MKGETVDYNYRQRIALLREAAVYNGYEIDADLYENPARYRELRAAFGLPDDGKEWCEQCQMAHEPGVHEK